MKVRRHIRLAITSTVALSCGVLIYAAVAAHNESDNAVGSSEVVEFDASTKEVRNVASVSSTEADTAASAITSRSTRVSKKTLALRACKKNELVRTLYEAGFRGENLREAWSIAMRESNGKEQTVSSTGDYGLFQFNYPTWGNTLDYGRILDGEYNAAQAFRISKGGRTWAHWGLTGDGQTDPSLYGTWSSDQVWAWITEPYQRYYKQYPCS